MPQIVSDDITLRQWTEGFQIRLDVGRIYVSSTVAEIAYVSCQGQYITAGAGEACRPLLMAIRAALAWDSNRTTSGLIADLKGLEYRGGDRLLSWRHDKTVRECVGDRVCIVASRGNHPHIKSLLEDEDDEPMLDHCHHSILRAVEDIMKRATDV